MPHLVHHRIPAELVGDLGDRRVPAGQLAVALTYRRSARVRRGTAPLAASAQQAERVDRKVADCTGPARRPALQRSGHRGRGLNLVVDHDVEPVRHARRGAEVAFGDGGGADGPVDHNR